MQENGASPGLCDRSLDELAAENYLFGGVYCGPIHCQARDQEEIRYQLYFRSLYLDCHQILRSAKLVPAGYACQVRL